MILYIHGFGSSGSGAKAIKFKEYYNHQSFIAPSLSYIPTLAIDTLESLIELCLGHQEEIYLIGSSLGGYMAIYLASKYNLKAVLINPSINPRITLKKVLGLTHNYYDLSSFEWTTQHLNMLKYYQSSEIDPDNFLLLLQKGDETLDYREAERYFLSEGIASSHMIIEEGGNHGFEDIESKFLIIDQFFGLK